MRDTTYKTGKTIRLFDSRLAHQYADNGWGSVSHRIAVLDKDDALVAHGAGTSCEHPAILEIDGFTFIAFTAAFSGLVKHGVMHCLTELRDTEFTTSEALEERVEKIIAGTPKKEIAMALVHLRDRIQAFRKGRRIDI